MWKNLLRLLLPCVLSAAVLAQPTTFPTVPFHGLELTYSLDGAVLESEKDSQTAQLHERRYTGRAFGTLRVAGYAKAGERPGRSQAMLRASLFLDDKPVQKFEKPVYDNSQVPFSLEMAVPATARTCQFFIHLSEGGEDGVRVRGTLNLNPKTAQSPMDSLLAIYRARIPKGLVSTGPQNNILSVGDARYDGFCCGGYQKKVLDLLDELRYSADLQERTLMDAFDYGPIEGLAGAHQAVVIYPKGTDWEKTGTVLDPWLNQAPSVYSIASWASLYDPIRPSREYAKDAPNYPLLGGAYVNPKLRADLSQDEERFIARLQQLSPAHYKFQAGMNNRERKSWVRGAMERFRRRGHVFVDCPVQASVVDAQGRAVPGTLKLPVTRSAKDVWTQIDYNPAAGLKLRLDPLGAGPVTVLVYEDDSPSGRVSYQLPAPSARQDLPLSPPGHPWAGAQMTRLAGSSGAPARLIPPTQTLFDNFNPGAVRNGPPNLLSFKFLSPVHIHQIRTYHYGLQADPGSVTLVRGETGQRYGPWACSGLEGQGGVANAFWVANPDQQLPAGTYRLEVSNPASWSYNEQSGGCGFASVHGYPAAKDVASPYPLSGEWIGTWSNSVGESGADTLALQEDRLGNLSGVWSGNIPVRGRRLSLTEIELRGSNARRDFTVRGTLQGEELVLRYNARRLDAQGSYTGECHFRKK